VKESNVCNTLKI